MSLKIWQINVYLSGMKSSCGMLDERVFEVSSYAFEVSFDEDRVLAGCGVQSAFCARRHLRATGVL